MQRKLFVILLVAIALWLGACAPAATPEPTAIPTEPATATATDTATPEPTATDTPEPTPTPLVSEDGGQSAILTMSNGSDRNIIISWMTFEGIEEHIKRLLPGQSYEQPTFVGHAWRVRDEASNEIVKSIIIKSRQPNEVILIPNEAALGPTLEPTLTQTPSIVISGDGCVISDAPDHLGLAAFFTRYCDADGIAIVSSETVRDQALQQAWLIVMNMLAPRPDVREEMVNNGVKFAIFSINDDISDVPYFDSFEPGEAFAAASGSINYPIATNQEGNLLCWAGWQYSEGAHVGVHEFAHAMHMHGLWDVEPDFDGRLEDLYNNAMEEGKWPNHYGSTNHLEYWAEGVMNYFNGHPMPSNGEYINNRAELKEHDPALFEFISEIFRGFEWMSPCP